MTWLARQTFEFAVALLGWLTASPVVEPARLRLGTSRFTVMIEPACSGIEGVVLFSLFFAAWAWRFREDLSWPRAWLLWPLGMALNYSANVLRVVAMVLVGDAGARDVALGGFHENAGVLIEVAIAGALIAIAPRCRWLWKATATELAPNPVIPYLLPWLSILAAGLLAGAGSAGFDHGYPFRLLLAAGVLWALRPRLPRRLWRFNGVALASGVAVFVLWLTLAPPAGASRMPPALAAAPDWWQVFWLAARVVAAVVTVPLAEELAFRGFLMRRLSNRDDFEAVTGRAVRWPALVMSALVFGAMHMGHVLAGTAAGLVYGGLAMGRGGLGTAVAAHATTNALLAGWVLCLNRWDLWGF